MGKFGLFITGLAIILSLGLSTFAESQQQLSNRGDGGGAPSNLYGDYPAPKEI